MQSLKEVRTRVDSVKSTQQITRAMKMVAASKLRKAQNAILKLRPYATKMNEIIQNLSTSIENNNENVFAEIREIEKILIVSISSNRGLCGAFNSNIIKETIKRIKENYTHQHTNNQVFIYGIGKKNIEFFMSKGYNIVNSNIEIFDNLNFNNVVPIATQLMNDFLSKKYDKIEIIYNKFKNAATQYITIEQFLPILKKETHTESLLTDYILEPTKEEIIRELIPRLLKIKLYKAILNSFTSEHGARMTAMHKATDNAEELLKNLRLTYNKTRQASITNEILEIVGGAEALKG